MNNFLSSKNYKEFREQAKAYINKLKERVSDFRLFIAELDTFKKFIKFNVQIKQVDYRYEYYFDKLEITNFVNCIQHLQTAIQSIQRNLKDIERYL